MNKKLYNLYNKEQLIQKLNEARENYTTISFYKYHKIENPNWFRDFLYTMFSNLDVLGRVYLAEEGINAQIAVTNTKLEEFQKQLFDIDFLNNIRLNLAVEEFGHSFYKLKIKVRHKIVADGINDPTFDPSNSGVHVNAEEFNQLVERPETIIVDMRNHYESEIGHFKNAITPDVVTFRESLPIITEQLDKYKDRPIVMYCTGGIRCEKASAYFKHEGFTDVYQLNGGIINYAREVQSHGFENKFIGKNFVFDERLGERISNEIISRCHQCGNLCDTHANCKNEHCHILFLQCPECSIKYDECCSQKCVDYLHLSADKKEELKGKISFNGSKFSKGRYKALGIDDHLDLT
ncbi:MAG: rhodanese-related sulfurtransferase [Saprospiraceae bacterium]|nr:rhodanese-related sulfurtransferase [Saprospiraceae bacterium]